MNYSIERIKEIVALNPNVPIIYFWGHTPNPNRITAACLSQWYECRFEVDGVLYHTAEQYMMAGKARVFGDNEVLQAIMEARTPNAYKKLGRLIKGFVPEVWDAQKLDIVVNGNKAKFSQNPELKEFLLSTGEAILVEASPYDRIWGIGLDREQAQQGGIASWRGENLLGCALMEVRDWLRGAACQ